MWQLAPLSILGRPSNILSVFMIVREVIATIRMLRLLSGWCDDSDITLLDTNARASTRYVCEDNV